MPNVSYHPQAALRPFLPQAGLYGPDQDHEAKVVVYKVALAEAGSIDAPFADKQCTKDSYTVWQFQVIYDGTMMFVRSRAQANTLANSGSKNLAWFTNLGLVPTDDEDGNPSYDLDKLVGTECIIKVAKPNQDKEDASVWYSGAVVDVFGMER